MSTQIVGAFSPYTCDINDEAKAAFADAMENFIGVSYSPLCVAQQIVSGTNYSFFCNAELAIPGATSYPAIVDVYKPLDGRAMITHIEKVNR